MGECGMKLFDINVFDWGYHEGEGQIRVCLDAYPVKKGPKGYYETDTSVDPISLQLTDKELRDVFSDAETYDTWIHSETLLGRVDLVAPRVYNWINKLHNG
jgi:hypothetical protein